jgi:hypothetical protein
MAKPTKSTVGQEPQKKKTARKMPEGSDDSALELLDPLECLAGVLVPDPSQPNCAPGRILLQS